ncbi:MAG: hypothetical protein QG583_152 [Patescibacteria group bacterium]|nr:hypothetical protein [Patescibacteria group bacterium]
MVKKVKNLYLIILVIICLVVIFTFYKIFILRDYLISYQVACDPNTESCFILECDQEEGEDCNIDESEKYFKLVEKKAFNAVKCSSGDVNCLLCQGNEMDCTTTMCDPLVEENYCSDLQFQ